MRIVRDCIALSELIDMSAHMADELVKAVVDIDREIIAVDAGLHVDLEGLLLEDGSHQENLWGINLHPKKIDTESWIEFDSMINIRPAQGNMTRDVENEEVRAQIKSIVNKVVQP